MGDCERDDPTPTRPLTAAERDRADELIAACQPGGAHWERAVQRAAQRERVLSAILDPPVPRGRRWW